MPLRSNFEPGTSRWATRRANYENISQVLAAMETIGPDGAVTLYDAAK
jgi:hypothetical protein